MIVLGIDPGTLHLGWGVVFGEGNRISHLAHGVIDAPASQPLAQRLVHIDRCLNEVIAQHRPSVGSVESLFFHKDAQAASKLGHARGVVLLNLARAGMQVMEYPPARVKSTLTGHGRADKQQMVRMVGMLLGLGSDLREDAADALALAVTYLRRAPVERALAENSRRPAVLGASAKTERRRANNILVVARPSAK